MVIISKRKIVDFYNTEPKAREVLLEWYHKTALSDWRNYHDIKQTFNSVDSVGNDRYVFNVGGNKYRIIAIVLFPVRTLLLRFVGTHKDYDKIDCKNI